jgi:hypothetical protein
MRRRLRAHTALAVLVLALTLAPALAQATPTVKLKVQPVPIPGFPKTGDILGAGTGLHAEYTISGTEYFGSPAPVIATSLLMPEGMEVDAEGFPVCLEATIQKFGPRACPAGARAGAIGNIPLFVTFGGERVEESAELFPFYNPVGGITYFVFGHSPTVLEMLGNSELANLSGENGYGARETSRWPLIPSVPGAPFASFKTINMTTGTARQAEGRVDYYARLPRKCPSGGFAFKSEVTFAENGEESKPQVVSATSVVPCPTRSLTESEEPPAPPQTTVPGTDGAITAPSNKVCTSRRDFEIHVKQLAGLTYRAVSVFVNGRRVKVVKGTRISAPVNLRGLPKGLYTVRITVTTTTGRRITGTRSYHTCARRPLPGHSHPL